MRREQQAEAGDVTIPADCIQPGGPGIRGGVENLEIRVCGQKCLHLRAVLGIKQRAKWDITVLPFRDSKPIGAAQVGSIIRERIQSIINRSVT